MGGDVTDELRLEGVGLVGQADGFLLLAGKHDVTEQDDGTDDECTGEDGGQDAEPHDEGPTVGQGAVLLLNGSLMVGNLLVQGTNLVGHLQRVDRVFPCDVTAIRLRHHAGVARLSSIGNKRLIDLVHLVVVLGRGEFVGHLLEHGITLRVLAEGVVVDGLAVEQVVAHALVGCLPCVSLHDIELVEGTGGAFHLDVHLHALLRGKVVHGGLLAGHGFLVGLDGLVHTAQEVEGFLVEVLLVVHGRGLDSALHARPCLSFVGIVVKGMDIQRPCLGNVLGGVYGLSLFLQLALLLCTNNGAAAEHSQKKNKNSLLHIF